MIKKVSKTFEIVSKEEKEIYNYQNKIIFYNEEFFQEFIDKKFMKEYKNILMIILSLEEDDNESDTYLVLDKINELKSYLYNEFGKYLTKEMLRKYLNMMTILEFKIPVKSKGMGR